MNKKSRTAKGGQRTLPPDRYEAGRQKVATILASAKVTLVNGGYAQLTLRRVADEANLPLRHLQYYYRTKNDLLRALCESICDDYIVKCNELSAREHSNPKARFIACVEFLIDDNRDPFSNTLFFELWALACHDEYANRLVDRLYAHFRAYIADLIVALQPSLSKDVVALRAVQIVSLIEGLTLFIGRNKPRLAGGKEITQDASTNLLRLALGK